MSTLKGRIFEIKKFAVHDGDGIRTTLFLKGCPLKCVWCHNPEGIGFGPQLAYLPNKCIGCGRCVEVCPQGAHEMSPEGHVFHRERCIGCGKCEEVCLGSALLYYGKEVTVEEVLPLLLEDRDFYESSDGGVTLSGGECLMQADFCAALLKALKENGIHTAVDTCGFVSREALQKVMPYTDIFLYDMKSFDREVHHNCTGQFNDLILENLKYLDDCGKATEVRIPYVPEYNDDQMPQIADFLAKLSHLTKVRVLAYHNYAGSKYASLDMENHLPQKLPTAEELAAARACFEARGIKVME